MIPRNAVPIAHVTPRPRIQIGQADVRPSFPDMGLTTMAAVEAQAVRDTEILRIWSLIKGAAEGSNVTSSPVVSEGISGECA